MQIAGISDQLGRVQEATHLNEQIVSKIGDRVQGVTNSSANRPKSYPHLRISLRNLSDTADLLLKPVRSPTRCEATFDGIVHRIHAIASDLLKAIHVKNNNPQKQTVAKHNPRPLKPSPRAAKPQATARVRTARVVTDNERIALKYHQKR
jgi:hypothetical protein